MRAIEKGCRPADNITASKRRTNVLKRYINRIYSICLLNTLIAIVMAIVYMETKNETAFAVMSICEINALIAWICAS